MLSNVIEIPMCAKQHWIVRLRQHKNGAKRVQNSRRTENTGDGVHKTIGNELLSFLLPE